MVYEKYNNVMRFSIIMYISFVVSVFVSVAYSQDTILPFSFKIKERTDSLPEYIKPDNKVHFGGGVDSPVGYVLIDGEVWIMFNATNMYATHCEVARFKGSNFENAVQQPNGTIDVEAGVGTFFCGGMWYDESKKKLYAPIHCEYKHDIFPPAGWCRKKTRLASSTDKGLTWRIEGDILTDYLPEGDDWLKYSGSFFEAGPADFDFYVDRQGGYFYIFTSTAYIPKSNKNNTYLWFNEAARCAISDKMSPGKWYKFCNGTWTESGLGGKSSRISMGSYGMYGRVIYSTYLKKYLRIGVSLGCRDKRFTDIGFDDVSIYISACTDLSKQDWLPKAKLLDMPDNKNAGITLTDENFIDPFVCGQTLHAYNYWLHNDPSRELEITLDNKGVTPVAGFPEYGSYAYEPHPESCDPVESRKTKIVGCSSADITYSDTTWNIINNSLYFNNEAKECKVKGSSISFSFKGADIYWRAEANKDCGKADVYIDGKFENTVDCYYREFIPTQFAFIKTGLDPAKVHTAKIVVRGDKNPESEGTAIRHIAFEYSTESYRASAGYSSVMGKNNWFYQQWNGKEYSDLNFLDFYKEKVMNDKTGKDEERRRFANYWQGEQNCKVGNNYQVPGSNDAVRKWIAPHDGKIRIEGNVEIRKEGGSAVAKIMNNDKEIWPSQQVEYQKPASHDFTIHVKKSDTIYFIVGKNGLKNIERTIWDPVITYEE